MSEPFLGQLVPVGFNFAPVGWHLCDGTVLQITENTALFVLLGTTYGGDGQTTFALPDLRSRVIVGVGQGAGLQAYQPGQQGGEQEVGLAPSQFPTHSHALQGAGSATTSTPGPGVLFGTTATTEPIYATAGSTTVLSPNTVSPALGQGQPHDNRQPFTTINYIIALEGIFPSRA